MKQFIFLLSSLFLSISCFGQTLHMSIYDIVEHTDRVEVHVRVTANSNRHDICGVVCNESINSFQFYMTGDYDTQTGIITIPRPIGKGRKVQLLCYLITDSRLDYIYDGCWITVGGRTITTDTPPAPDLQDVNP